MVLFLRSCVITISQACTCTIAEKFTYNRTQSCEIECDRLRLHVTEALVSLRLEWPTALLSFLELFSCVLAVYDHVLFLRSNAIVSEQNIFTE